MTPEERAESLRKLLIPFTELPEIFWQHVAEEISAAVEEAKNKFESDHYPKCDWLEGQREAYENAAKIVEEFSIESQAQARICAAAIRARAKEMK